MTVLNLHIRRVFLLFCILLCAGSVVHAGAAVPQDSSEVEVRRPDEQYMRDVYQDKDWRYVEEVQPQGSNEESFFDRLLRKMLEGLFDSNEEEDEKKIDWFKVFFLILGVALLVFFVLKATGTGTNSLFRGRSRVKEKIDATVEDVDIHGIDYEGQIRQAKTNKDFRLAVRLWFLRSLKELSDGELIKWTIDKTNSDYYYEIKDKELKEDFSRVSLMYEYIWYGDFSIGESDYEEREKQLTAFYQSVKRRVKS